MHSRYHPDKKGGSTGAFQRIAIAFETLSDAEKRQNYDDGVDVKKEKDEDCYSDEEEEQSLREEIERK
jgi:DnaJ-class molecular chaperone